MSSFLINFNELLFNYTLFYKKIFLTKKGISREIQDDVLAQFTYDIELAKASIDAEKKLNTIKRLPSLQQKTKLFSFLKSKGYSMQVISTTVDTLVDVK